MIARLCRWMLALAAPFVLTGCLLTPGKFTSTMSVNADRSFTFSYVGEVYAVNTADLMKGMNSTPDVKPSPSSIAFEKTPGMAPDKTADPEAQNRAIADALAKEEGFRKVQYLGEGKFLIDYQIKGRLDHAFVFPYNLDAEVLLPFILAELRIGGTTRIQAPGLANDSKDGDMSKAAAKLDGTFTIDTDAEVISQNTEDGLKLVNGRKTMTWKATPATKIAPMVVIKFAP